MHKLAYLLKIGAHVTPSPDANILKGAVEEAPKIKKGFLGHMGRNWPGYLAGAGLTYGGYKLLSHLSNREKVASIDPLEGGMAEGEPDSNFNKDSIEQGMKVEREHTIHKSVQKRIAKDHLKEDPKYYLKLKKMEAKK